MRNLGYYVAGEVVEFSVECGVTLGGSVLRKTAVKYAGAAGRRAIVPHTSVLRKRLAISSTAQGQIHHINPVRDGRFPLPFKFSSQSWNLKLYEGVKIGRNAAHINAHKRLRALDRLDLARTWSSPIRSAGNEIVRRINDSAGDGAISVQSPVEENEFRHCFYAPDIIIEIYMYIYLEENNSF